MSTLERLAPVLGLARALKSSRSVVSAIAKALTDALAAEGKL